MPKKPTIIVRAADGSRRELRPKRRKPRESKAPSLARTAKRVKVESKRWQRAHTPAPSRDDLTAREWAERGDLLKVARTNSYEGAHLLSLSDLRDVQESITRCQIFNV